MMTSRREKAAGLFFEVAEALTESDSDLISCFRKYQLACQLLGLADQQEWATAELNGYSSETLPQYREATSRKTWGPKGTSDNITIMAASASHPINYPPMETGPFWISDALPRLIDHQEDGFNQGAVDERTLDVGRTGRVQIVQSERVPGDSIKQIVFAAGQQLYQSCIESGVSLRYGDEIESVFEKYRSLVEPKLADLGFGDHLEVMTSNLAEGTPASLSLAALAARNILQALSDSLWQVEGDEYPHMTASNSTSPMRVTQDLVRNRLRAYLHQHGIRGDDLVQSQLDLIIGMIDTLYGAQSAGKGDISPGDAQFVVITTYVFVGELIRLTGAEPLQELVNSSAG